MYCTMLCNISMYIHYLTKSFYYTHTPNLELLSHLKSRMLIKINVIYIFMNNTIVKVISQCMHKYSIICSNICFLESLLSLKLHFPCSFLDEEVTNIKFSVYSILQRKNNFGHTLF